MFGSHSYNIIFSIQYTASGGPDTDMSKVTMSGIPLTCFISNEAMH